MKKEELIEEDILKNQLPFSSNIEDYQNVSISNKIIKANQKLTITEKRMISYCISKIDKSDKNIENLDINEFLEKRKFSISADSFSKLYEYKNKNNAYRDLKSAAKNLFERSAQLKFEESEDHIRFVDRVKYHHGNGVVDLYFTPEIYLHLCKFDGNFTQYNLKIGTSFKSMYAHRIFELLQSRKDTNCIIIKNKEFRFILDIPSSYKTYAKIKEKVFNPTIKEFEKFGMTLNVSIVKNRLNSDEDIITISTNKNVNDIVKELGLTEENRLKLIKKNKKEVVLENKIEQETRIEEKKLNHFQKNNMSEEEINEFISIFGFFTKEEFIKMPKQHFNNYLNQYLDLKKTMNNNDLLSSDIL